MILAVGLIVMLIGFAIVGFLFLEFSDRNSDEPKSKRFWTDPKNR